MTHRPFISALCSAAMLLASCSGGSDSSTSDLGYDFASRPDTIKARILLDKGLDMDSLARFMCMAGAGLKGDIKVSDFPGVENYIYNRRGETDLTQYMLTFEETRDALPLAKKLPIYKKTELDSPDKLGYTLGLAYVGDVINKNLTIGQVDREIAELRKACGSDEETYNRFLKAFAVGLSKLPSDQVDSEILRQYRQYK